VCCTEVQGFLFSRPRAARDLDQFLSGARLSGVA